MYKIRGKTKEILKKSIILECNNFSFEIFVIDSKTYQIDEQISMYTEVFIKDEKVIICGFNEIKEKEMFLNLLKVNGVGIKFAFQILNKINTEKLIYLIINRDIETLKINIDMNESICSSIINKLYRYYKNHEILEDNLTENDSNLVNILKGLGYKIIEINKVLPFIKTGGSLKENLSIALQRLKK